MTPDASWLDQASRHSRYVRRLLARDAAPAPASLALPYSRARMEAELASAAPVDDDSLRRALRQLRARVMLHVMTRDLAGAAPLEEVTGTMTDLAEVCVQQALMRLHPWLAADYGEPLDAAGQPQDLVVVAMGKLGGGELNVSSDIDLIFVYPEDGQTAGRRSVSVHEFFTRLGRRLIGTLAEPTGDGFVFRVDMRLRPYGDSGPLVVSFDMLEEYLLSQGRAWERYAWVKARAFTGRRRDEVAAIATPFVYRRHLDFSAIQSMRELHAQIASEVRRRDIADNVKLGPGGIREVEFTAQVFQLIRGGREPELRVRPTLAALQALATRGQLPEVARSELEAAYRFLRALEHRIQYLDDQQTQELPTGEEDRALLAESMGHARHEDLLEALARHRGAVSRQFDALFATGEPPEADPVAAALGRGADPAAAGPALEALGFPDGAATLGRVLALRSSARFQHMSAATQARLDQLLPRLVRSAAAHPPAEATLERLLRIVESIGRRESYLALLLEYPQALEAVSRLVSLSSWACEYLARQPMLLDELIDERQRVEPDWPALDAALRASLDGAGDDTEAAMDRLRHFRHIQTFRLLALDLAGVLGLERLSDHLSELAGRLLEHVLRLTWRRLPTRHRDEPAFAVVGYGKLGGKELGYESDLDIIFLYDDPDERAGENYARLAQRMNGMMNSRTGAGMLYETDLRLRPDGASGLLVSRLEAFEAYQRSQAWTWEHQALTRARFVAGDAALGARFEALRHDILCAPREPGPLREAVAQMRQKMLEGHPNDSGLFDLKHDRGGIVDVEFAVQYLVLAHAARLPALAGNIGNIALLRLAEAEGLLPAPLGERAADAYRAFRREQHALRLRGERYARLPADALAREREAVEGLWRQVMEA